MNMKFLTQIFLLCFTTITVSNYWNFFENKEKNNNFLEIETTNDEDRELLNFIQLQYFFDKVNYKKKDVAILKDSLNFLKKELSSLSKEEPIKPSMIDLSAGKRIFDIFVDLLEFPELAGYRYFSFENDEIRSPMHDSLFFVSWDSLYLKKDNSIRDLVLVLTKEEKKYSFYVHPVFKAGKDFDEALQIFLKKQAQFQRKLNKLLKKRDAIQVVLDDKFEERRQAYFKLEKQIQKIYKLKDAVCKVAAFE